MTMQLPLSAFLITRFRFLPNSWRVFISFLERLGRGVLSSGSSASVFSMYFSSFLLLALGGFHCDFGLKGCFLPCRLLFRKWCVMRRCLARASRSSLRLDLSGGAGTGA